MARKQGRRTTTKVKEEKVVENNEVVEENNETVEETESSEKLSTVDIDNLKEPELETVSEEELVEDTQEEAVEKRPFLDILRDDSIPDTDKLKEVVDNAVEENVVNLATVLLSYVEKMFPGKLLTAEKAGHRQYGLMNAIKTAFSQPVYDDFKNQVSLLLFFFKTYDNTVTNDANIFRYMEHFPGNQQDVTFFFYSVDLLKLFSNNPWDKARKQINVEKATSSEAGFTEEMATNVRRFFFETV